MTERREMYLEYKQELCAIDDIIPTEKDDRNYLANYDWMQDHPEVVEWVSITAEGTEVGFILISNYGDLDLMGDYDYRFDYFILDSYIEPAYRRQGLVEKALRELLDRKPGTYGLYILKKNEPALNLWKKLWKTYPQTDEIELIKDKSGQEYAFEVKGGSL